MTDADQREETLRFGPLSEYSVPAMPTRDTLQMFVTRMRKLLRRTPDQPMITDERLQLSSLEILDAAAAPPACGPLIDELQATLADWVEDTQASQYVQFVVMPPGDRNSVVAAWAERHGHHRVDAPSRHELISSKVIEPPLLSPDDGVLVIPALEDWFVRHRRGLRLIRALLAHIAQLDRKLVVGCNSWAWQYLVRAVRANIAFPEPITFQAFDAARLRAWFREISTDGNGQPIQFLDADTGDDILALEDDDKPHPRLVSLAARSLGVPWIAWRLWRHSLRHRIENASDANSGDDAPKPTIERAENEDAHTLWVTSPEEFSLPARSTDDSLVVLHALLIHGVMQKNELALILPFAGCDNVLMALVRGGLVERDEEGRLACAPEAYPAIRSALTTAGFPIAEI